MKETYTKSGSSVRIERSGRSISTLVTREHGRATRERGHFRAESLGERQLASAPDVGGAAEVARKLVSLEGGGVEVERLTVVAGIAEHALTDNEKTTSWTEETARVHLSLVSRAQALRVSVDLGAPNAAALPIHFAIEAAEALRLTAGGPLPSSRTVELSPQVAAALWRFVADHPALIEGSRIRLMQSIHPAWPFDGSGTRVERRKIIAASSASLFRPSYRIPPVPAWFHSSATLRGARRSRSRRRADTRIVALLRPFRLTRTSVSARVLARTGDVAFAADLDIPREDFASTIIRMAGDETWFPFEAGAWGRDTVLEGARVTTAS